MIWSVTKWILGLTSALLVVVAVPVVLLCVVAFVVFGPTEREIDRVVSTDGKTDAVMIETNGGATTDFGYLIYVVDHGDQATGSELASLYGAWQSQTRRGATLRWQSPTCLPPVPM